MGRYGEAYLLFEETGFDTGAWRSDGEPECCNSGGSYCSWHGKSSPSVLGRDAGTRRRRHRAESAGTGRTSGWGRRDGDGPWLGARAAAGAPWRPIYRTCPGPKGPHYQPRSALLFSYLPWRLRLTEAVDYSDASLLSILARLRTHIRLTTFATTPWLGVIFV